MSGPSPFITRFIADRLGPLIRTLVSLVEHEREWNFFQGKPVLTTEAFPCDLDTTSVALTVTGRSKAIISSVMDEMLNYVDKDGIVQVSLIQFGCSWRHH